MDRYLFTGSSGCPDRMRPLVESPCAERQQPFIHWTIYGNPTSLRARPPGHLVSPRLDPTCGPKTIHSRSDCPTRQGTCSPATFFIGNPCEQVQLGETDRPVSGRTRCHPAGSVAATTPNPTSDLTSPHPPQDSLAVGRCRRTRQIPALVQYIHCPGSTDTSSRDTKT